MSRVTSRSREVATGSRWPDRRYDVPRELDDDAYSAAVMSQAGVDDDGDQFLVFTMPTNGSAGRKTKVWCYDNGGDHLSTNGNKHASQGDRGGAKMMNWFGRPHATTTEPPKSLDGRRRLKAVVDTRLTSSGQTPSSSLSPCSPRLVSPMSRPSALPVRIPTSSGTFHCPL